MGVKNHLMDSLERDLLSGKPLTDLLQALIIYGGHSQAQPLVDWARKELSGFGPKEKLPEYRKINAPLVCDWVSMSHLVKEQSISPLVFPEDVRHKVPDFVPLTQSVTELESIVARSDETGKVRLGIPLGPYIVDVFNSQSVSGQQMERTYWVVSVSAIEGVLGQIRTRFAVLLSQLRKETPRESDYPSPEGASRALTNTISGDNNTIHFAQATDSGTATTMVGSRKTVSLAQKGGIAVAALGFLAAVVSLAVKIL